jgi:RNA polymerase sigma factor (sigma-70 family)
MRGGGGGGDTVRFVLNSAGRTPLLTAEQEIHLATLIQAGKAEDATPAQKRAGRRARDHFMRANMRLVIKVASGYKRRIERIPALDFEDLIGEGMIGLARGVDLFDPTRGYKASTFLYWWCKQAMGRAIAQHGSTIRLPQHVRELWNKMKSSTTLADMALCAGVTQEKAAEVLAAVRIANTASLDEHLRDGDGDALGDMLGALDADHLLHDDLAAAVERLRGAAPDETAALELRVEGATMRDLAPLLGCHHGNAGEKLEQHRRRLELLAGGETLALLQEA